jgi:hypothetical protein
VDHPIINEAVDVDDEYVETIPYVKRFLKYLFYMPNE